MTEHREPTYVYSEKQVADKSAIARDFIARRARLNQNVNRADNLLVKRFYNLDHNTYLEGVLPAKYKELMGLVASACLRCDDCINYHIIQSFRLAARGASLDSQAKTSEVSTDSPRRMCVWQWARASSGRSRRGYGSRTPSWQQRRGIPSTRS